MASGFKKLYLTLDKHIKLIDLQILKSIPTNI